MLTETDVKTKIDLEQIKQEVEKCLGGPQALEAALEAAREEVPQINTIDVKAIAELSCEEILAHYTSLVERCNVVERYNASLGLGNALIERSKVLLVETKKALREPVMLSDKSGKKKKRNKQQEPDAPSRVTGLFFVSCR